MMIRGRVRKHRRNKRTNGDVETYGRMRRFEELKKTVQLSFQSRRLKGAFSLGSLKLKPEGTKFETNSFKISVAFRRR